MTDKAPDERKPSKTQRLANAIAQDLLRSDRPRREIERCFLCDREMSPLQLVDADDNPRFCSIRCRDAYDAGAARNADHPDAGDFIGDDLSRWRQIAGPPIPRCHACGNLCVELYRKDGNAFCHWRCRDGQPRDCIVCGKNLYNVDRKGPYCSTGCANNLTAKRRSRVSGAKR